MNKTKDQQAQEYAEKVNYPCPDYGWYESDDEQMKECLAQVWLDGYTACEQSMTDSESDVIQGWVARDKGGMLRLHYTEPKRMDGGYWQGGFKSTYLPIGKFPFLAWSDEPIEVEITIKPKKR